MKTKRKRFTRPTTTEGKIQRLKRNFSKLELMYFEMKMTQKYGLNAA